MIEYTDMTRVMITKAFNTGHSDAKRASTITFKDLN